jgi:hypothetical protein
MTVPAINAQGEGRDDTLHFPDSEGTDWHVNRTSRCGADCSRDHRLTRLLPGHVDEAVELFKKARAANPRLAYVHFFLAAAFGMKGDLGEARASLAEAIKIKPAWDTMAHFLADCTFCGFGNPQYRALAEKMIVPGWRRAGLPDQ